jgi:methyl-accepting chemotaxis protein
MKGTRTRWLLTASFFLSGLIFYIIFYGLYSHDRKRHMDLFYGDFVETVQHKLEDALTEVDSLPRSGIVLVSLNGREKNAVYAIDIFPHDTSENPIPVWKAGWKPSGHLVKHRFRLPGTDHTVVMEIDKARWQAMYRSGTPIALALALLVVLTVLFHLASGYCLEQSFRSIADTILKIGTGNKFQLNLEGIPREFRSLVASLKQLSDEFSDQIEYSRSLIEAIYDPLFIVDETLTITYLNEACEKLSGYTREEAVGKMKCYGAFLSLSEEDTGEKSLVRESIQQQKPISEHQITVYDRQKQPIPVSLSISPVFDSSHNVKGAICILRDLRPQLDNQRRYLQEKMRPILKAISQITDGNLTTRLELDNDSELGELARWINNMRQNLNRMLVEVSDVATNLASASAEISAGTEELSRGALDQKEQVERVAATIQEIAQSVSQVSAQAREAGEIPKRSAETTTQSLDIIRASLSEFDTISDKTLHLSQRMKKLGESIQVVHDIASMIEDIADQTNLLALNAAIEAARAGEHGRGFAVVADEVKKLANRTTSATRQIASAVTEIQQEAYEVAESVEENIELVQNGQQKIKEALQALETIHQLAEQVARFIQEFTGMASEQQVAADKIQENLEQVTLIIQQSTSNLDQLANATGELHQLAEHLQALVSRFEVDRQDASKRPKIKRYGRRADDKSSLYVTANGKIAYLTRTNPPKTGKS